MIRLFYEFVPNLTDSGITNQASGSCSSSFFVNRARVQLIFILRIRLICAWSVSFSFFQEQTLYDGKFWFGSFLGRLREPKKKSTSWPIEWFARIYAHPFDGTFRGRPAALFAAISLFHSSAQWIGGSRFMDNATNCLSISLSRLLRFAAILIALFVQSSSNLLRLPSFYTSRVPSSAIIILIISIIMIRLRISLFRSCQHRRHTFFSFASN